jgi:hypothetical protein
MTVLQEILKWSQSLPAWQGDAIARLFAKSVLSDDDLDDLFALLKAEHGIPDPRGRTANKLSADQIPTPAAPNTQIKLLALKNLCHVNNIAENQRLAFGANGLTVIYGDNGSGKSGYSRVPKHACRARDQSEPIHPNVFMPPDPACIQQATFEVEVNGTLEQLDWVKGKPAPPILSSLAVFDLHCARSYLDDEGDYAYVPYGLDILEGLAGACRKLKGMIEAEHARSAPDMSAFSSLRGDTTVGKLIAELSHRTRREQVEALAAVSEEDVAERGTLRRNLNEGNPKEKATQLRLRASRIARIAESAVQKLSLVDAAATTKLRRLADDCSTAQEAAAVAAQGFREDRSLLPGSGGEAWKQLFEAARKFSVEAYPGMKFPEFGPDAQCPLCQQPLAEGAKRLRRFEAFVQQNAEKTARTRKEALAEARKVFARHTVSLGMEAELYAELCALDKVLASDTREFETVLAARHTAINSLEWGKVAAVPPSPAARLQSLVVKLNVEVETLEGLSDEKARAALQARLDELEARIQLARVKEAVLRAIEGLDRRSKLTECLSAVKTNAISLKASELTEQVVSKDLSVALNEEFRGLGVGGLQVSLQSRGERGKLKLKLELPQVKTPAAILSEGEQRAIAIGSFLAEVTVGGRLGGIIFDDPVSSLDQNHRESVARRLAQEAKKRQVIIFTHDIYFLFLLVEEAQDAGVPIEKQSVAGGAEGFGVADPDLPFEGMSTNARVGYLRNLQQDVGNAYRSGDVREHRKLTIDAYRQLRNAWERAIEEVLFCEVVLRFRKSLQAQRLVRVSVEDTDWATVERCMSKCSDYCHDQAPLGGLEVPDPHVLLSDINALEEWRKQIDMRGKEVQKRRKSGP